MHFATVLLRQRILLVSLQLSADRGYIHGLTSLSSSVRYQQNYVNGETFNIRSRSLNGAFYWIAQMLGGLIIGVILDLPFLSRPNRARVGWAFLFVTGE